MNERWLGLGIDSHAGQDVASSPVGSIPHAKGAPRSNRPLHTLAARFRMARRRVSGRGVTWQRDLRYVGVTPDSTLGGWTWALPT